MDNIVNIEFIIETYLNNSGSLFIHPFKSKFMIFRYIKKIITKIQPEQYKSANH